MNNCPREQCADAIPVFWNWCPAFIHSLPKFSCFN